MLWILGFKIDPTFPYEIKKAVIVHAPHTSNWDFFIGRLAFSLFKVKIRFLIKKEVFKPVIGSIIKGLGGIPVDRSKNNRLTDQLSKQFTSNEEFFVLFTPEGTRSYVESWKKGFYYTAIEAKVPILLCYIDYTKKTGGFGPVFHPTGDAEKDIAEIMDYYRNIDGKYPEKGVR